MRLVGIARRAGGALGRFVDETVELGHEARVEAFLQDVQARARLLAELFDGACHLGRHRLVDGELGELLETLREGDRLSGLRGGRQRALCEGRERGLRERPEAVLLERLLRDLA